MKKIIVLFIIIFICNPIYSYQAGHAIKCLGWGEGTSEYDYDNTSVITKNSNEENWNNPSVVYTKPNFIDNLTHTKEDGVYINSLFWKEYNNKYNNYKTYDNYNTVPDSIDYISNDLTLRVYPYHLQEFKIINNYNNNSKVIRGDYFNTNINFYNR